jgi:hypothetical protein
MVEDMEEDLQAITNQALKEKSQFSNYMLI